MPEAAVVRRLKRTLEGEGALATQGISEQLRQFAGSLGIDVESVGFDVRAIAEEAVNDAFERPGEDPYDDEMIPDDRSEVA